MHRSYTLRRLGFCEDASADEKDIGVLRIDGAYLYEFGATIRPVANMAEQDTGLFEVFLALSQVKDAVKGFLHNSVFSAGMKTLHKPAETLLNLIDQMVPTDFTNVDWEVVVPAWRISGLKYAFRNFEAVLTAMLQTSALYYVSQKGGFDTACLTDAGESVFPSELAQKEPSAVVEIKAAMRCIAFELPTAAGFHLHRANEAVLRRYFDEVAGKDKRPKTRNMGDYLRKMEDLGVGDAKVIAVLKSLKDLHRNPLMHPEDAIGSMDEALSLYAAIRAAIGYMLDRIPMPSEPATLAIAAE